MSLPSGFLDELRARISVADVVGRRVKLTKKGREYQGLCPFHNEKTPSFTVNEEKGFYHCFGCGAHGDIIKFEMEIGGLGFMEAIEKLAAQAGMQVPKSTPQNIEKEKKRTTLIETIEFACDFFEKQLRMPTGKEAYSYLLQRGLSKETIKKFRLGFAPSGNALKAALSRENIQEGLGLEAGLIGKSTDRSRPSYDYFRNRIIFPIMDIKGRPIAFGGRVMDDNVQPKYLNSPETSLFHKGKILYALSHAREHAFKKEEIIVTEGYMDVIALANAGINNAVAPLGTAVSEDQIMMLWKMAAEPTMCLDGDNAGRRAAMRAAERALPILNPGKSLKFALLPEGIDPDDMIKTKGKSAFEDVISSAMPLSELIWKGLLESKNTETPEQQAAIEKEIERTTEKITDKTVRQYYSRDLKKRLNNLFYNRNKSKNKGKYGSKNKYAAKTAGAPRPKLHISDKNEGRMLLAYMLRFPKIADKLQDDLIRLEFDNKLTNEIIACFIDEIMENPDHDTHSLKEALVAHGYENVIKNLKAEFEMFDKFGIGKKIPSEIEQDFELRLLKIEEKVLLKEVNITDLSPESLERSKAMREELNKLRQRQEELENY
ncbi:MAG: DNA primase [Alphaproteobacteria bacterium]|nr:DNA primase [Alphaproteobacteria bacterium]